MKLSDIVALAKSGYTVSDIKELLALANTDSPEPKVDEDEPEVDKEEPEKEEPEKEEPEVEEVNNVSRETLEKKIISLEKKLADAQALNRKQVDVQDKEVKTTDELVEEMLSVYM